MQAVSHSLTHRENLKRANEIISHYPPQYKKAAVIPLLGMDEHQCHELCGEAAREAAHARVRSRDVLHLVQPVRGPHP